jgi:hypothetical protein
VAIPNRQYGSTLAGVIAFNRSIMRGWAPFFRDAALFDIRNTLVNGSTCILPENTPLPLALRMEFSPFRVAFFGRQNPPADG